jgi:hypothetical protein
MSDKENLECLRVKLIEVTSQRNRLAALSQILIYDCVEREKAIKKTKDACEYVKTILREIEHENAPV